MAEVLLKYGANKKSKTEDKATPFQYAEAKLDQIMDKKFESGKWNSQSDMIIYDDEGSIVSESESEDSVDSCNNANEDNDRALIRLLKPRY